MVLPSLGPEGVVDHNAISENYCTEGSNKPMAGDLHKLALTFLLQLLEHYRLKGIDNFPTKEHLRS